MRLKTVTIPEDTVTQHAYHIFTDEGWERMKEHYGDKIKGHRGKYTITFPECEHTYAPTLAEVYNWLHGDYGPFHVCWKHGELCPFAESVGHQNTTCSNGLRKRCNGLLIEDLHTRFMPPKEQRKLIGRVICYKWCHILNEAYWKIPQDELLGLPDDPGYVAMIIMRRVFRETGWWDWMREKKRRKDKGRRDWLKCVDALTDI